MGQCSTDLQTVPTGQVAQVRQDAPGNQWVSSIAVQRCQGLGQLPHHEHLGTPNRTQDRQSGQINQDITDVLMLPNK